VLPPSLLQSHYDLHKERRSATVILGPRALITAPASTTTAIAIIHGFFLNFLSQNSNSILSSSSFNDLVLVTTLWPLLLTLTLIAFLLLIWFPFLK
jgi:hypothetical protein